MDDDGITQWIETQSETEKVMLREFMHLEGEPLLNAYLSISDPFVRASIVNLVKALAATLLKNRR